jgi:hypothetical protein
MDRRPGDPPRREVVVHVDAEVLADDTAAGRAHFEGGPSITGAQARRMLCEATAVVMLEKGREPLAVGRRRRRATKPQRRALLRRDGGCARPGCPETRIERLHAHHMRHWLFGGRTELANLVLLCDGDHGLVHDHGLVLSRKAGRLIVLTTDGRHIWGTADAAFTTGLAGVDTACTAEGTAAFTGVHPIDDVAGRRPADAQQINRDAEDAPSPGRTMRPRPGERRPAAPARHPALASHRRPAHRPPNRRPERSSRRVALGAASPAPPARAAARLSRLLFPDAEPPLGDTLQAGYDRLDLRFAIGVLMGNRDLARRLAAEATVPMDG